MVQVPIIEQDKTLDPVGTKGMLQKVSNPYIARSTGLEEGLASLALAAKKQGDESRAVESQRWLQDWQHQNIYDPANGALSKQGKDAFNLPQEYGQKFDKEAQQYMAGLADDTQRQHFMDMATQTRGSIYSTLDAHSRGQMDSYFKDNTVAAQQGAKDLAIQMSADDKAFQAKVGTSNDMIRMRLKREGNLLDQDGNETFVARQEIAKNTSDAYLGALKMKADADPKAAIDFYKANMDKFTKDDFIAANAVMTPTVQAYKAHDVASKAITSTATSQKILDSLLTQESGGKDYTAGGAPLTSKKGAKYAMQVMPETAKNPGYGIAPAKDDTPEEYNRVGRELLAAMMNKYGDLDKALAAYNSGTGDGAGPVDKSIQDATDAGEPDNWKAYMHKYQSPENLKQTQDYVKNIRSMVGDAEMTEPTLPEAYAYIDKNTNDLDVATKAKALVKAQFEAQEADKKKRWDAADEEAAADLAQGLPVKPSTIAKMEPKRVVEMKNASPDPAYYETIRQAVSAGEEVDLPSKRWQLGSKYDELLKLQNDPNLRANARKVDDVKKAGAGIILGKASPSTEQDFQKLRDFEDKFDQNMAMLQKQMSPKVPSADDADKVLDRMLMEVKSRNSTEWYGHKKRQYELTPDDTITEYPGIPQGWKYYIKGKSLGGPGASYSEIANKVIDVCVAKGLQPNEANVSLIYKGLVRDGVILEKR